MLQKINQSFGRILSFQLQTKPSTTCNFHVGFKFNSLYSFGKKFKGYFTTFENVCGLQSWYKVQARVVTRLPPLMFYPSLS